MFSSLIARKQGVVCCTLAAVAACAIPLTALAAEGRSPSAESSPDPGVQKLAQEVADLGWLVFAGKSAQGDYDLFVCRPDGSKLRNITNTP